MSNSIDRLNSIRKEASEMRDRGIKARATMEEVQSNISNLEQELRDLGINNTSNATYEIEAMESEADEIYESIVNRMNKYR